MKRAGFRYKILTAFCAVLAMTVIQSVGTSTATGSPSVAVAYTAVDLSAESRTLDAFVDDLTRFDKRAAELGKKPSLARAEVDSLESSGDDLKRRLSGVQNSLAAVIRKLKAADQWDNLNAVLLAQVSDSQFQSFVRSEDFKKLLEDLASTIATNKNEIDKPLAVLRARVARAPVLEAGGSTFFRVAYRSAPAVFGPGFRCRLAGLRFGVAVLVYGATTRANPARVAYRCHCLNDGCSDPTQ